MYSVSQREKYDITFAVRHTWLLLVLTFTDNKQQQQQLLYIVDDGDVPCRVKFMFFLLRVLSDGNSTAQ